MIPNKGGDARVEVRGDVMRLVVALSIFFVGMSLCSAAWADPCEGALPRRAGETFSGTVRYVGDGDGLCVGTSSDPSTWIEVRVADFNAPELNGPGGQEARATLRRLAMGREASCTAQRGRRGRVVVYDRVIAVCRIDGRSVGDLMREAGVSEGRR